MKIVNKPWGREEWLELNERYCYKRIYIKTGHKTSYQYHLHKRETNYIIDGTAEIWLENDAGVVEKKTMSAGDYFNVTPPKKHRVIALTDIILQEVSTPEVDDVIRIDDDTKRADGRIESEHTTPAVLILAAGKGSRLKHLTETKNKALLPINNKAIISHIIEKFPITYDIIVAVGYKAQSLQEYCLLAHPDRKFQFVSVTRWEDSKVGPGQSAKECKKYLQRPFYITTADCMVDTGIIHTFNYDWLGVSDTVYPEKYSTIETDAAGLVTKFVNKSSSGFDNAFIGLAYVHSYDRFWSELERSNSSELIDAWTTPSAYPVLKTVKFNWFDTGNFDDLQKARTHFSDTPLSLQKNLDEITYKVGQKFIKYNSNETINANRAIRAEKLTGYIPDEFKSSSHFISYDWQRGQTLYTWNSLDIYLKFLTWYQGVLTKHERPAPPEFSKVRADFYRTKTFNRIAQLPPDVKELLFHDIYVDHIPYPPIINGLERIISQLETAEFPVYDVFHGDLQFDNVLYSDSTEKFTYLDWRESMAGNTDAGDVIYDLAKIYGGLLLPYNLLKLPTEMDAKLEIVPDHGPLITYSYKVPQSLKQFKVDYKVWVKHQLKIPFETLRAVTALIYINMAPLHDKKTQLILIGLAAELLNEVQ